jgi:hypothetical protein
MGMGKATVWVWKKLYGGGVEPSEQCRLRRLEEENLTLKQIVADLSLDKAMMDTVVAIKFEALPATRVAARIDAATWMQPEACRSRSSPTTASSLSPR